MTSARATSGGLKRVAKTLETLTAAKAVCCYGAHRGSTKSLVEPLIHAAGPDWAPRFVGDKARAKAILEKVSEDEEAIPLLVLERGTGAGAVHGHRSRDCGRRGRARAPYWPDADDAEAAERGNAFRENDAGYRAQAAASWCRTR